MAKERFDFWDPGQTYVLGHQRPDTDAIAAALGYAWFLTETGGENIVAARAGQVGEQASFALRTFDQAAPRLVPSVAPTFGHASRPQESVAPHAPIVEAMARFARGANVVPVVGTNRKPAGVVTPLALTRAWSRPIGGRQVFAKSCQEIAETLPAFPARDRISDHRNALLRSEGDDFLVVDDEGLYVGVTTRGRILDPPRARLVLVDHNELSQAVPGADEAEIVAVLDHHRLSNPATAIPIPFLIDPVGSSSTLVAEKCRVAELSPPRGIAGLLLSGVLSDTLVFRSPTATPRDRVAGDWLAGLCGVKIDEFGPRLLSAAPGLSARTPAEVVDTDRKLYQMGTKMVSLAQVEVSDMQELPELRAALLEALSAQCLRENLAFSGLMITNVVKGRSHLLCHGDHRIMSLLPFPHVGDEEYDLGDMVSRKKQLAPAIQALMEEGFESP